MDGEVWTAMLELIRTIADAHLLGLGRASSAIGIGSDEDSQSSDVPFVELSGI
jgi:hypothetical protein